VFKLSLTTVKSSGSRVGLALRDCGAWNVVPNVGEGDEGVEMRTELFRGPVGVFPVPVGVFHVPVGVTTIPIGVSVGPKLMRSSDNRSRGDVMVLG
jgi:hypothetical protein